jgi:hypothetical protein
MSEIVSLVIPFFGLIVLGYGTGRAFRIPDEGLAGLRFFVFYLAMPALFFQLIAETGPADAAIWSFVLTTSFSTYCAFAMAFSIGALVNGGNVPEATVQGLVGSYANVGYMAPALTVAAFGSAAAVPMALIFSFDSAVLLALAPLMMALGGTVRTDPGELFQNIARQILLHPFIIATVLGFIAASTGFRAPAPIDGLLTLLRSAAAPGALFMLGVGLSLRPMGRVSPEMPVVVGVKLVAHPTIVYLLLSWVGGFTPLWVHVAVLMAALPPALEVYTLARQYDTSADRASTATLLATLVSIATVTFTLILLLNDLLPINPFR